MRRAVTSLLLLLLSLQTAIFFGAADDANLPACCRRLGKHHCSMAGGEEPQSSGQTVKEVQAKCPLFPSSVTPPAASKFVSSLARTAAATPDSTSGTMPQVCTRSRAWAGIFDNAQKRGPPADEALS